MKTNRILFILLVFAVFSASQVAAGIVKTAKTFNFLDIYGGPASILGEYGEVGVGDYQVIITNENGSLGSWDGSDIYKSGVFVGLKYGQLRSEHFLYSIGFQYTSVKFQQLWNDVYSSSGSFADPQFRLFDAALDFNYYFLDPTKTILSPFAGIGFKGGVYQNKVKGFTSSYEMVWAANLNFGAELNIWKSAKDQTFLSLISTNEYQFTATDARPKYLQFGIGLRYYFRY